MLLVRLVSSWKLEVSKSRDLKKCAFDEFTDSQAIHDLDELTSY